MTRAANLGLLVVLAGCGGGGDADARQSVDVTFTRTDGSLATFPDTVRAWCGPYDDESPETEAVHVMAGERRRDEPTALWILSAVHADVERNPVTTLRTASTRRIRREPASSPTTPRDRENELSSADEEAKGTIRVELEGCEPGDMVRVELEDVVLGSEYHDLPPMSVAGTVVAEIGEPPS